MRRRNRFSYKDATPMDSSRLNELFNMVRDLYSLEDKVEQGIREVRKSLRFEGMTNANKACDVALRAFQDAYQKLVDIEAALDKDGTARGL